MVKNENETLDVSFDVEIIAHELSISGKLVRSGYKRAWMTETFDRRDRIEISSWVPRGIPLHCDCHWSKSTDYNLVLLDYFGQSDSSSRPHTSRLYCVSGIPPRQDYDAAYPWPVSDDAAEDARFEQAAEGVEGN